MPSLINELIHKEVSELVNASPSIILIDPAGLKADQALALRRQLQDVGATMKQAKARIITNALPQEVRDHLDHGGSLALVVGEDIAAAAKVLNDAAKQEQLVLKAGMVEGQAVDAAGAKAIANLPTKTEAQAMFVRAIRAPAVKLAKIVRLPYVRLARGLNKHKENLEEG